MWNIIVSTLAAAFGVQSRKNLEADFDKKTIVPFIVAGIIFTVVFILSLVLIVKIVLNT